MPAEPAHLTAVEDELLTRAFELAVAARAAGDHPFGAVLAVDGRVVAEAVNRVNSGRDVTAHAETELVRLLERDGNLELLGAGVVYASCEPCPMCVGAMFWAGARRVVFGLSTTRLTDVATAPGTPAVGFAVTASAIASTASPAMDVRGPFREADAVAAHVGFWW